MTRTNTLVRSLHDVGMAAWFGGSLMGAVGVNGAADDVREPRERIRVATAGWDRWTPVNAVAIGLHLVGAVGMLRANQDRVRHQPGVASASAVKTVLTGAALAATAYAGVLGRQAAAGEGTPARGGVTPAAETPAAAAAAQKRLRVVQWVVPALTGALTVIGAQQGEQQRPAVQVGAFTQRLTDSLGSH
ncbi:hypothetical protein [Pseudonocardia sp. KRD291]|uniref:hypothetical protein n=1 Tax=Pseudonocardia sp. KRD291 TaxID=2792007 RepID=UPI001C49D67F|nr:hypothetical protein [Pseudonocardia sp. KRD291]MBW0100866.1 hypothetical protein [Pseudonocardia sp. KRD291]